jgi:antitoxin component of MazEF toxin-antitoxin module
VLAAGVVADLEGCQWERQKKSDADAAARIEGASDMEMALIRHGHSLAIAIDKSVLDLLWITADTKIELTTNGDSIMLTPVRDRKRQSRLQAALQKINNQFGDDLKKLAEQLRGVRSGR